MHEHNPVHELDAVLPAGVEHFSQLYHTHGAWFFADNVFPGLGGSFDP
jgi:hypothetical protein